MHLNESIASSAQCLYLAVLGEPIDHASMPAPRLVVMAAKLASLLVIGVAALLVWRHREDMRMPDRSLTLALFAMLSASASPVAWRAAYTVALLALALLWGEALQRGRVNVQVILLAVCTVAITSYANEWIVEYLMRIHLQIGAMFVSLLLPWTAVLLVLHRLSQSVTAGCHQGFPDPWNGSRSVSRQSLIRHVLQVWPATSPVAYRAAIRSRFPRTLFKARVG